MHAVQHMRMRAAQDGHATLRALALLAHVILHVETVSRVQWVQVYTRSSVCEYGDEEQPLWRVKTGYR